MHVKPVIVDVLHEATLTVDPIDGIPISEPQIAPPINPENGRNAADTIYDWLTFILRSLQSQSHL